MIQIMCSKGCGSSISVDDETLKEATAAGQPLDASHEVCPRDATEYPEYRVLVTVYKTAPGADEPVVIATSGGTTKAHPTFVEAFDELSNQLNEKWLRVGQMRHVVEE